MPSFLARVVSFSPKSPNKLSSFDEKSPLAPSYLSTRSSPTSSSSSSSLPALSRRAGKEREQRIAWLETQIREEAAMEREWVLSSRKSSVRGGELEHPCLLFLKENVEDSQEEDVVEMSETSKGTLKPTLGVLGGEAMMVKGNGSFMRKKVE